MYKRLLLCRNIAFRHQTHSHRFFLNKRYLPRYMTAKWVTWAAMQDDSTNFRGKKSEDQLRHLELLWAVTAKAKPVSCSCCKGSGRVECRFCYGTGVLTVGDALYCTLNECAKCPVCNAEGIVECKHCLGTGSRASWIGKIYPPT